MAAYICKFLQIKLFKKCLHKILKTEILKLKHQKLEIPLLSSASLLITLIKL